MANCLTELTALIVFLVFFPSSPPLYLFPFFCILTTFPLSHHLSLSLSPSVVDSPLSTSPAQEVSAGPTLFDLDTEIGDKTKHSGPNC